MRVDANVSLRPIGHTEFDDDEVTEADPSADTFLGRVCRDWEAQAREAEKLGVRVVAMRTGGPDGACARSVPSWALCPLTRRLRLKPV